MYTLLEAENVIYGWRPSGLIKIMSDENAWGPKIIDVHAVVRLQYQKDQISIADVASYHFGAPICRFHRFFSAHVGPSIGATDHHSILISVIYKAAVLNVRQHQPQQPLQQIEQHDLVDLPGDQEEEQQLQRQEEEEQQRQKQEEENEKRAEEMELLEKSAACAQISFLISFFFIFFH